MEGFQRRSAADFLNWPNRVWSIGPSLAQTIVDGGSRRAKVRQSLAAYDVTMADYRQEQDSAIGFARRTLDEASVRYHFGINSYLNVITAQTALLNAR